MSCMSILRRICDPFTSLNLERFIGSSVLIFLLSTVHAQISPNSLHFDGNNFVIVGEDPAFDLQANTATTFEGWIRFCDDGVIFSKNWCNSQAGYIFHVVNGGQIRVKGIDVTVCNQGQLFDLTTSQFYSYNTWHHFALVIETTSNTTDVKVYMNGALVLSTVENGLINNSNQNLILGAYKILNGDYSLAFVGDMDEIRVYNAALTPAELGLAVPSNPSLVVHYQMEPQTNPMATTEPNLGTLGSSFEGNNVLIASPVTPTSLDYVGTSVFLPTVDLGADIALACGVNTVDLLTNNSANTYTWEESSPIGSSWQFITGANSNQLSYTIGGTNTTASVAVTGSLGFCVDSDTITITTGNLPSVFLGNDTSICSGTTLLLDASGVQGNYLWQDNSTGANFTVSAPGTYWVEVTDNGCVTADTIVVSMNGTPNFTLGNDTTLCFGDDFMLDASGVLGDYIWQDGSINANYSVNQAGVYWVTVTNSCGSTTDSIQVDYTAAIVPDLGSDTTLCSGSTLEFVCDYPNTTATWQDGSVGPTFIASQAGEYSVQLNSFGCLSNDTIVVAMNTVPVVTLGEDRIICDDAQEIISVQEQNGSILWNDGSSEPSIVVSTAGIYSVSVTNMCGTATDSISIGTEQCFCVLYVPNTFTPNDDEFNALFGPVFDCALSAYSMSIYNRWGEVVFESEDPYQFWDGTHSNHSVPDGVYTYKITYSSEYVIADTILGHVVLIR